MRRAIWMLTSLLACAPERPAPPPPEPDAPRVRASTAAIAAAAERALAQEADQAAEAAAPTTSTPGAGEPEVQILRGRGTTQASSGSSAKGSWYGGARWLQGRADGRGLEVLVFWEPWCGYCRAELPKLQAMSARTRGVEVVGLTSLSKGADEASARRVLDGAGVRFPIAVVPESTKTRAGVNGVPHALVVRSGAVLWRGHPAGLDEAQLTRWARGD